jgi:hypothetical protein
MIRDELTTIYDTFFKKAPVIQEVGRSKSSKISSDLPERPDVSSARNPCGRSRGILFSLFIAASSGVTDLLTRRRKTKNENVTRSRRNFFTTHGVPRRDE